MSARPFKLKLENGDRKIGIVISSLKGTGKGVHGLWLYNKFRKKSIQN